MKIHQSAEDYLESILVLHKRNGVVHAVDIASERDFTKPSVSVAMKNLRENGYITVDEENQIELTDSGREIAEEIYERHRVLSGLLIALGVPPKVAEADACRMEHAISPESFRAIKKHVYEMLPLLEESEEN